VNCESLVAKVWNCAMCWRPVSYQAYISQISYLLFLMMDEERTEQLGEPSLLPAGFRGADLRELAGEALAAKYGNLLETLSRLGSQYRLTLTGLCSYRRVA
jgi:type I restriction enzyme M protein